MDYQYASPVYFPKNPGSIYMGYGQNGWNINIAQDRVLEDLEYLTRMYPSYAKRYQSALRGMIAKLDYEGSFIYDQYPDRITFVRLVESAMKIIREDERNDDKIDWEDSEPWIRELVTVVMYNEILTLRRKKNRYMY